MALCGDAVGVAVVGIDGPCAAFAGFSFATIAQAPTPSQISRVCSSPQCSKTLAAIRQAVPNECTVASGDKTFLLYKEILDPIAAVCSKGSIVLTREPLAESNTTVAPTTAPGTIKATEPPVTETTRAPSTTAPSPASSTVAQVPTNAPTSSATRSTRVRSTVLVNAFAVALAAVLQGLV